MKNVRMMLALLMMTAALVGAGCGKADSSSEEAPENAAEPVSEEVEKVQSEQAGSDHTDHEGHDHD